MLYLFCERFSSCSNIRFFLFAFAWLFLFFRNLQPHRCSLFALGCYTFNLSLVCRILTSLFFFSFPSNRKKIESKTTEHPGKNGKSDIDLNVEKKKDTKKKIRLRSSSFQMSTNSNSSRWIIFYARWFVLPYMCVSFRNMASPSVYGSVNVSICCCWRLFWYGNIRNREKRNRFFISPYCFLCFSSFIFIFSFRLLLIVPCYHVPCIIVGLFMAKRTTETDHFIRI